MSFIRTVFNRYRNFHNMSLTDLLAEEIAEQEAGIAENRLGIYDRIVLFRNYLVDNYRGSTIQNSISKIKTFYHYNRVRLPYIPSLNTKSIMKNDIVSFEDLPTKDELREALKFADDNIKLWIYVIVSSGSTRAEAKSMTNETFFEGTRQYHKKENFKDALRYLSRKNNVVCTCKLIRHKTDKPYYTFLNPECVQETARIKLRQHDFDLKKPLLEYEPNYVNHKFKILNDRLGFGRAGGYSRLRPHMLRKFNSTYLNQGLIGGNLLDMNSVDLLHGRGKNMTRETYYKENPEYLKFEYVKAMNSISLYRGYDWRLVNGKVRIISKPL